MKKHLPSVILAVVLLLLWQGIAMIIDAAYILPSPTQICVRLWELREPLFLVHLPATMKVTAIGLLISIVLGILLAVAMDANEKVERALYPVIVASQTIPTTAIAPLFILWFGYSIWSKVLVTILITFFPIAITEWLGAQEGLGYFSKRMMTQLDGAGVFAPVVLLSITAMLAVGIITVLEYRFIKWRKEI